MIQKKIICKPMLSNNSIPIINIFNRMPVFVPLQRQDVNSKICIENPIIYKNSSYEVKIAGSRLSLKYDYPLMALIVRHWINKRIETGQKVESITISLDEINSLFIDYDFENIGKREATYIPIKSSLLRLTSCSLCLESKNSKVTKFSPILSDSEFHYDDNDKKIIVKLGSVLQTFYEDLSSWKKADVSLINVQWLAKKELSEPAKALMKFLMKQDYVEFDLSKLLEILNHQIPKNGTSKDISDSLTAGRRKVKDVLNELKKKQTIEDKGQIVEKQFVTAYRFKKKRNWDAVWIILEHKNNDIEGAESELDDFENNAKPTNKRRITKK